MQFFVFLVILLSSCTSYKSSDGKVSALNTANKNSFSFSVSENFFSKNSSSKKDKNNPLLTKAESGLLEFLLEEKSYCMSDGDVSFIINSKQEKVYDVTYAHLIEENYNAKPVTPRTYFGHCAKNN